MTALRQGTNALHKMNRTCYTAIFGNYDDLKQPFIVSQHWRYVCYTDQDLPKNNVWEIRKVPVMDCGPAKTARWYKINFHEHIEEEESLWVDATFFININLNRWWRRFSPPMTVVQHPFDNCIYTDVQSCLKGGKGNMWDLMRQALYYKEAGIPENNGLISSGILMRRKTPEVVELCKSWWRQVEQFSERDQIAFGYAGWKHPVFNKTQWNYTTQKEFIHCPHIHKPWRDEKKREIEKTYGTKSA